MEKSKDIKYCKEYNDPKSFDSPGKVAEWMRDKDFAFDFRNDKWTRTGGIEIERNGGYVVTK